MKKRTNVRKMTLLGLLTAILLVMSLTPLGYLNIGPLAMTLNMIPVAIAAIALGPTGGAIAGLVFGLTSFGQCIGIGGISQMGQITFAISPVLTFLQRVVARVLAGWIAGWVYRLSQKMAKQSAACFITGFFAAFLNTVFFMSALVLLFGRTEYVQEMMGGRNILVFICASVGVNAVAEMIVSTVISGIIGSALKKARVLER